MSHSPVEEPVLTGWHSVDQVLHTPIRYGAGEASWDQLRGPLAATVGLLVSRYQGSESVIMSISGSEDTVSGAAVDGRRIRINDQLPIGGYVQDFQRQLAGANVEGGEQKSNEGGEVEAEVDWPIGLFLVDGVSAMESVCRALPEFLSLAIVARPENKDLGVRILVREGRVEEWMVGPMAGHLECLWAQVTGAGGERGADSGMLTEDAFQKIGHVFL